MPTNNIRLWKSALALLLFETSTMSEKQRKLIVVSLATNDPSKVLVLSNFDGNQDDPHQCEVNLKSGTFGFEGKFYFDNFASFTASVEQMAKEVTGVAELREDHRNQFIKLEISKPGHVLMTGMMEQHREFTQSLSFGFKTDQTCLAPFARDLRKIIA